MFVIMIVTAAEAVLLMIYGVVRMVLNERAEQRIQRERAAAFFAAQDERYVRNEAAAREAALRRVDQRAS
jgi:uncharacterized membrane protein YjfL (UPF0719 family)